eukprot:COSAG03_NODE_26_length_19032_cov_87.110812_13_plen_81_part_00
MTRGKRWTEPLRTLVARTGDVLYNSTHTPMNQAPLSISNVTSPPSHRNVRSSAEEPDKAMTVSPRGYSHGSVTPGRSLAD